MKRLTMILAAAVLLAACSSPKADVQIIEDFYKAVLGQTEMTEELLKESLSDDILASLWEEEYTDTYSFWKFRTEFQDGPAEESILESIKPLGDGWYQVSYTDMGTAGVTEVKVQGGKITSYKPFRVPYTLARNYFKRNDNVEDVLPLKLTSEEELLRFFGYAAFMGKNGEPTKIDFDKSFVIPIILPETDQEAEIVIDGLYHSRPDTLILEYGVVRSQEHLSYTMLPFSLLIVDKDYQDCRIEVLSH